MLGNQLMGSKVREWEEDKPGEGFFLFAFVCFYYLAWLAYRNAGVFLGSLRADEIHFLQNSWMAYSGHSALEYIPPLYHYALMFLWGVFDGDLSLIYALRFFNFLLFFAQGILVFKMFAHTFPGLKGRWFSIAFSVLAASFVTLLSAFRGYEIRPEGVGNTLLLLGIFWLLLDWKINSALRYALYLAICVCLVIAASLSFRFALPSFFLWIAAAIQMLRNNEVAQLRGVRSLLFAMVLSAASIVIIDYLFVDWGHVLEGLQRYSLVSAPMDWKTRFTINAWPGYGVFCLMTLGLVVGLVVYSVVMSKAVFSVRLVNALLVFSLSSFYLFLFVWDVSPRAYIHSIEWVLILGLSLFSIKAAGFSRRVSFFAFIFFVAALLFLGGRATNDLSANRSSWYFLASAFEALSQGEMARQDDSLLVRYFDHESALPDQINSRREFCARHRGSFVVSGSILYHPICLVDMGTYDFSGWGNKSVDLLGMPSDRSLFVLSAPVDKVAPLIAHYGDRYKPMANVRLVGGGLNGEIQRR
jgi:hypothetical protein